MILPKREKELAQLRAELISTQGELERRERQLRKEAEEKLSIQAQLIDKLAKSRFAIKIRSTYNTWEVLNWNGDYRVTRVYRGLTTGEGIRLEYLTHKAFSSTPESKFGEARLIPEMTTDGVTMDFGKENKEENEEMFFRINFPEKSLHTDTGADYAFEYTATHGVLMTREAAEVAYRNEPRHRESVYHINEVFNELLQLELKFPTGYPANTECLALINQVVHADETKRLQIDKTARGVSMTVNKPLPGFWYLIEWDAPSEVEFQQIRQASGSKAAV